MNNLKEKIIEFGNRAYEMELRLTYRFGEKGNVLYIDMVDFEEDLFTTLDSDEISFEKSTFVGTNFLKFAVDLYNAFFVS